VAEDRLRRIGETLYPVLRDGLIHRPDMRARATEHFDGAILAERMLKLLEATDAGRAALTELEAGTEPAPGTEAHAALTAAVSRAFSSAVEESQSGLGYATGCA
jgi:hypothetical protein